MSASTTSPGLDPSHSTGLGEDAGERPSAEAKTEPDLSDTRPAEPVTGWSKAAPWFLTVGATASLVVIGLFLVLNVEWFKDTAFPSVEPGRQPNTVQTSALEALDDSLYRLHLYHMHASLIKRSVGLFTGFALLFVGLGVAFYTIQNENRIDLQNPALTARLATASPGLVAVLVGAIVLIATIASKDQFPQPVTTNPSGAVEQSQLVNPGYGGAENDSETSEPQDSTSS